MPLQAILSYQEPVIPFKTILKLSDASRSHFELQDVSELF